MKECKRSFAALVMMPSLLLGASIVIAEPSAEKQVLVVYGELLPTTAAETAGQALLEQMTTLANTQFGAKYFSSSFEVGRRSRFVLTEAWSDQGSYAKFAGASKTKQLIKRLELLLIAPLDERQGTFVVPTPYHALAPRPGELIVIAHIDFLPDKLAQGVVALKEFAARTESDPGVLLFVPVTWAPVKNHFQLIAIYDSLQSFDSHVQASHTIAFRKAIQPLIGGPYNEREYLQAIEVAAEQRVSSLLNRNRPAVGGTSVPSRKGIFAPR